MYAIIDIETTGGKFNEEGITEIAIYRYDGHTIVDQFASLINPERPIQPFVANLTGIREEMLRRAPKFYEVAKRVVEITSDCVLVAHNAKFDNRMLTTEFDRLGYKFERETLCTVELSKKILPGLPSYSLGKLVKHLGIPLTNRHRAQGDAKATVSLFKLLLSKDVSKEIISASFKKDKHHSLKPRLRDLALQAPTDQGLYYLYNERSQLIFIGKGKNIQKKLLEHFTYTNKKSLLLQEKTASLSYELSGNGLLASLKEAEEIIANKPLYNKKFPNRIYTHQLTTFRDKEGYNHFEVIKADGRRKALITFSNKAEAETFLTALIQEQNLDPGFFKMEGVSMYQILKVPQIPTHDAAYHNQISKEFLKKQSLFERNILIIDYGREVDERSLLWISNGKLKGYGYFYLNHQIYEPEIFKNVIIPIEDVLNATHRVQNHVFKHRSLKIYDLDLKREVVLFD